jgi:hypothetical protein
LAGKAGRLTLLILLTIGTFRSLSSAPAWFDAAAEHCLTLTPAKTELPTHWDIKNYVFPFDLKDGFTVWNEDGEKHSFNLNAREQMITFGKLKKPNAKIYLYPNPKRLDEVRKQSRYYRKNHYFRDWDWSQGGLMNQNINIYVLSYEADKDAAKQTADPKKQKKTSKVGHLPPEEFPTGQADLKAIFHYKTNQYRYRRSYGTTNITRPMHWKVKGRYAALVRATLVLPHAGRYEFAVKANNLVELHVNGKRLLKLDKAQASSQDWKVATAQDLPNEPVEVEAYYCSTMKQTKLLVGWRAEGETKFKYITRQDYLAACGVEPEALLGRDARPLPIVTYNCKATLRDGQRDLRLVDFKARPDTGVVWKMGEKTLVSGSQFTRLFAAALSDGKDSQGATETPPSEGLQEEITCQLEEGAPLPIKLPSQVLKKDAPLLPRDVYVKLSAPTFIYDDEVLDLFAEFHSELPVDLQALIEVKSDCVQELSFWQSFGKSDDQPPLRGHDFVQRRWSLEGQTLESGASIEMSIKMYTSQAGEGPGTLCLDRRRIVFRKLSECRGLTGREGCFWDGEGRVVIPILHRPQLEEKRRWSLVKLLSAELPGLPVMVIADDFGEADLLSTKLEDAARSQGRQLRFEGWDLARPDADLVNATARMLDLVRSSQVEELVLIPSSYPSLRGTPARLQQRLLAAIIQTAQENAHIKKVVLSTPFPLSPTFEKNTVMPALRSGIYHLVRQQEVGFLSFPDNAVFADAEGDISPPESPDLLARRYVELILP